MTRYEYNSMCHELVRVLVDKRYEAEQHAIRGRFNDIVQDVKQTLIGMQEDLSSLPPGTVGSANRVLFGQPELEPRGKTFYIDVAFEYLVPAIVPVTPEVTAAYQKTLDDRSLLEKNVEHLYYSLYHEAEAARTVKNLRAAWPEEDELIVRLAQNYGLLPAKIAPIPAIIEDHEAAKMKQLEAPAEPASEVVYAESA